MRTSFVGDVMRNVLQQVRDDGKDMLPPPAAFGQFYKTEHTRRAKFPTFRTKYLARRWASMSLAARERHRMVTVTERVFQLPY